MPANYGRAGKIEEQKEKGESRASDRVPTPLPPTIFSNCGNLLQIIYNLRINNHLRDSFKTG
jgi:hypothetical protein